MLVHPNFDPIALKLGQHIAIRWYGIMYLIGFAGFFALGRLRIKRRPDLGIDLRVMDDLIFHAVIGVVLGGRLGYVLFYKTSYYLHNPAEILAVWQGGMSFHGGFLGVLLAMWFYARKHPIAWLDLMDFIAPTIPVGLFAGRLGNFINGELFGRVTDLPWGMRFFYPGAGPLPRHPSQLYEMALEGAALFVILWWYSAKPRPRGAVSGLFLIGYGSFRFLAEFTREPDDFLGLLALSLTMGQWLSLPMIACGIWLFHRASRTASEHLQAAIPRR